MTIMPQAAKGRFPSIDDRERPYCGHWMTAWRLAESSKTAAAQVLGEEALGHRVGNCVTEKRLQHLGSATSTQLGLQEDRIAMIGKEIPLPGTEAPDIAQTCRIQAHARQ
jgi:hypothetical protein